MTADPPKRIAPGARPVIDVAAGALLEHAEELAKRWAVELILTRPLDGARELPLEEIAREAPSLCAQAIRSLQSDVELARLTGSGKGGSRDDSASARRLVAIAGARDAAEAAEAVEALRGVLWEALLGESHGRLSDRTSARHLADVCDRLAYVCASALAAALDGAFARPFATRGEDGRPAVAAPEPGAGEFARASAPGGGAAIVDERSPAPALGPEAEIARSAPAGVAEIAIRDERGEQGPAAWIGSIGARLERFARDGVPFAVLLVEFVEMERLSREEPPEDLAMLAGRLERALAPALAGWSGTLTRERPGRCWLLAPGSDRAAARELAERLADAVASGVSHRGAPLGVAIGTAACPEDGSEPAALAAHADVGLYAARSAVRASLGRSGSHADEPA